MWLVSVRGIRVRGAGGHHRSISRHHRAVSKGRLPHWRLRCEFLTCDANPPDIVEYHGRLKVGSSESVGFSAAHFVLAPDAKTRARRQSAD